MDGRKIGIIFNNDINNILWRIDAGASARDEYENAVCAMLDGKPGVLAQNVGGLDGVLYRSDVATRFDTRLVEACEFLLKGEGNV